LRRSWQPVGLLAVAYLASRLFDLTRLPLFVDEAIHLDWARRLVQEGRVLRILDDGKLLQVVAMTPTVSWVADPAWWGRLTTVMVGGLGLWACFRLGGLVGARVGLAAAGLYVVCPFTLFYDRLALADGFLSVFAGLALYQSLVFQATPSRSGSVRLGLAMAAAVLSKVPGLVTLAFPPLCLLVLGSPAGRWRRRLAAAYGISLALIAYPAFHFFTRTGQLGMKAEVAEADRLAAIQYNGRLVLEWLLNYWTAPILVAGVATALWAASTWKRRELVLAGASVAPLLAFILVGFHLFPRYVLLATIPFLVLAARGLCALEAYLGHRLGFSPAQRLASSLLLAVLVAGPSLARSRLLLIDPSRARLPRADRFQYIDGWPSGYGWAEAAECVREVATRSPLGVRLLADRADHRTAIRVLRGYLMNDPRVEIIPVNMRDPRTQALVGPWARQRPALVLRSGARPEKLPSLPVTSDYGFEPLRAFFKPDGTLVGELYLTIPRGE
jgi:hypothetical protein